MNLSLFKKPGALDMQAVNFNESTVIGSRVYSRDDFSGAVELARKLPLKSILTHSSRPQDVQSAYACFERGDGVCEVVVLPNGTADQVCFVFLPKVANVIPVLRNPDQLYCLLHRHRSSLMAY